MPAEVDTRGMRDVLGRRLLAGVLDLIVLAGLLIGVGILFGGAHAGNGNYSVQLNGLPAVVFLVAALAYYVGLELLFGRTIGEFLVHIRAVRTDGGRLTPKAALLRNLGRIIDGLPIPRHAAYTQTSRRCGMVSV